MAFVLHGTFTAAAAATCFAFSFVLYHTSDDKSYYKYKNSYYNDSPYIFGNPSHAFLPLLNIMNSINAITRNAAIRPTGLSAPVYAQPI